MQYLLGDKCLKKDGSLTTYMESINGNDLIGIYFSGEWCPPSKSFTPRLREYYEKWIESGYRITIIFGTCDRDEQSFKDYFEKSHGDYIAWEFGDEQMDKVSRNLEIIPTLISLNKFGTVIDRDGRTTLLTEEVDAIHSWIK